MENTRTRDYVIKTIEKELSDNSRKLYKHGYVNRTGIIKDTKESYSEIIAAYLLEHLEKTNGIKQVTRESSYKIKSHDGTTKGIDPRREEERVAMSMFRKKYLHIGKVEDYQVPLKNANDDENKGLGKIDLVSTLDDKLYIIELKREDSKETLLRAILEIYTYNKVVDKCKLKADFEVPRANVVPAVLVFKGGTAYKQYSTGHPNVRDLMDKLGVKMFVITGSIKGGFTVERPDERTV